MQPVIIEDTVVVAAGATVENVIAANPSLRGLLECPFPAKGKLVAITTATGLRIDLAYGSKNVVASSELHVATVPEEPYDIVNQDWYPSEGDQLSLRVSNSAGGPVTLRYRIMLTPLVDDGWVPGMPFDMSPYPDSVVMQRGPIAIAAGAVDVQLLDGLRYERNPVPSFLSVLMTQSAIGCLRQLFVEQDRIAPPSAINIGNRVPLDPLDTTIAGVEVPANALQQLQVSNPTAGALNVFWKTVNQQLYRT